MPTKPYPFQLVGAKKIRKFKGRALLADEMGLGKTLQALFWSFKTKKARPIIVVCPSSLKINWQREAEKHVGMMSEILEGQKTPKRKPIQHHPIFIINYDILSYWVDWLRSLDPQVIIFDEVHYIKNRSSKRYKASQELAKDVKHVIAISGTPLTNRPAELWTTLNIVRPDLYKSFWAFAQKYCKPTRRPWGWEYKGATNLPTLHKELTDNLMIRRLKTDVLRDLPDKKRIIVPVQLKKFKEYREATTRFIEWLSKKDISKAKSAARAEALVKLGYLKRLAAELKLEFTMEWIDNFLEDSDGKLVVFAKHQKIIKPLYQKYRKMAVLVDGSVKGEKRQDAVDQFQMNKKVRLFFGNLQAAGVGLTLTKASVFLFAELDWVPADHLQAEDRIHRIGQLEHVFIYYLIALRTIEEDLADIIVNKQSISNAVLDGGRNHTYEDVKRQMLEKIKKNSNYLLR